MASSSSQPTYLNAGMSGLGLHYLRFFVVFAPLKVSKKTTKILLHRIFAYVYRESILLPRNWPCIASFQGITLLRRRPLSELTLIRREFLPLGVFLLDVLSHCKLQKVSFSLASVSVPLKSAGACLAMMRKTKLKRRRHSRFLYPSGSGMRFLRVLCGMNPSWQLSHAPLLARSTCCGWHYIVLSHSQPGF